ncbi:nucleoside triphosphate hydrolase protein [Wolfiporia cocos MD-104 SS10]|uniref:Nucleoside triphosphate hydrolase protein n=1 Tax=Wolfiporia cocos (strain MD-104) TaxID=742152 RepID=A0A2H3JQC6_WOLCO|nr:nucleoside triphosphate hydrolase protein [Wolfiporia cocos MD-104 SS10]
MIMPQRHTTKKKTIYIMVMGPTGVGKTTFINLASGSTLRVGAGLESVTDCVQLSQPFELDQWTITLVDTPGFDDTSKSDTEILTMISDYLAIIAKKKETLSGVLYMHRITDNRVGGIALRNFRMFMQLCGEKALPNAAIVLNMWNEVSESVRIARRDELLGNEKFFKPAVAAGATSFEHDNTLESAQRILRCIAAKHPEMLLIQQEIVKQHKSVCETSAGMALLGELAEQEKKHRERLKEVQKEIEEAIRQQDEEDRRELEETQRRLESARHKLLNEQQRLRAMKTTRTFRIKDACCLGSSAIAD